jgi:Na+/proline symporter
MPDLDDYQNYVDTEKTMKNLASLIMLVIAAFMLIAYTKVPDEFFGLPSQTVKLVIMCSGIVVFLGGLYVRFIHISDYENEF